MWGFALDPDGPDAGTQGDCYQITPSSARLTDPACTALAAEVPGPKLTVPWDAEVLSIYVTNLLAEPTSIVIPGQEMPHSVLNANGPTWDDGTKGPRTSLTQRVRSFGREALPNGGRRAYVWRDSRNNPFQPGTFLYQSGTDPSLQMHMGLYGAVTKDAAVGEAYPGVSYDAEVVLLYSEIDLALHDPPAAAKPLNYKPTWFLVNGEPYEDGVTPPESAGNTSGTTLIRFLNAGLKAHAPTLVNGPHMSVIAEDGHLLPYGREQYSVRLGAGKTSDALWNPTAAGVYPIYDRTLQLTNAGVTGGGMLSYLDVGP
jgi:FtsP/CotA-like multicopper oxidase with cupredoxin domain